MNGSKLSKSENTWLEIRYNTEAYQFFKVSGNVAFIHDQEFTGNIVDDTFFIQMHILHYNHVFRVLSEINSLLIHFYLIQKVRSADWERLIDIYCVNYQIIAENTANVKV